MVESPLQGDLSGLEDVFKRKMGLAADDLAAGSIVRLHGDTTDRIAR